MPVKASTANVQVGIATILTLAMICLDVCLIILHLALPYASVELFELFDLNAEANLPAWYSSVKLLAIGTLVVFLAYGFRSNRGSCHVLLFVAAIFIAMSVDEIAGLHERVGFVVDLVIGAREDGPYPRTGLWFLVFGLPVAVSFSLFLVLKASRLLDATPGTTTRILIGLGVFFSGALLVEALSNGTVSETATNLFGAAEEGLELLGETIVFWAMMVCIAHHPRTAVLVAAASAPILPGDREAHAL